jgi:hypothetical protein
MICGALLAESSPLVVTYEIIAFIFFFFLVTITCTCGEGTGDG